MSEIIWKEPLAMANYWFDFGVITVVCIGILLCVPRENEACLKKLLKLLTSLCLLAFEFFYLWIMSARYL